MSTATAAPPATTGFKHKPKKEKEREKKEKKEKKEKQHQQQPHSERLKVIVRRLPPNLPEEIFWQSVQNWVTDETVTWKAFYQGKFRSRLNKENVSSRAYIAFKSEEPLSLFSREYDGHLFRDKAGNEAQAVVEFAPYQKVPSDKKKADARNGTIEKDEDYISFINSLNASSTSEPVSVEALIASTQPAPQPKTTPLLEALKAEKAEKAAAKEKAALRHHHHIHPTEIIKKEDKDKKKGSAAPAASSKGTEAVSALAPGSKKAKKAAAAAAKEAASTPVTIATRPGGPSKVSKAAARHQGGAQTKAVAAGLAATPAAPATSDASGSGSANNASVERSTSPVAAPAASGSTSRRGRPVLGLGSRQFEAALSGAGVVGDQKSRRQKAREREERVKEEKEKAKEEGGGGDKDSPAVASTSGSNDIPAKHPPSSPKRDRNRRKPSVSGQGASTVVPMILGRIDDPPPTPTILKRENVTGDSSLPSPQVGTPGVIPGPGIGSGRGRGRGRGRGGRGGTPRGV
ncbi:hypothetical protein K435DRAFT_849719 [Dendrothele bispora CBS 962.96]|uniref:UPF3 domain-containing protein n=1 Tax=Dendrothele bispora (strain CBS 962.96) TaxID=1314807 RepID=A0A4S8MRJ2_DENBC|nr:hypothetical protein K435DRAFT_849719 [Dendrothele bispora CBS 962.96]